MIKFIRAAAAIMLMTIMVITTSCRKITGGGVELTTYTPQDITQTTAVCGCEVVAEQGIELTEIGVCWSENQNPTVADSHLSTRNCDEPFMTTITGLKPNTRYRVRAYALRGSDYFYYGMNKTFFTKYNSGTDGTSRKIVFKLYDSYGDGWDGASLHVSSNDGTDRNLNMSSGTSATYTLEINKGSKVSVVFNGGEYDSECYFQIAYEGGEVIYECYAGDLEYSSGVQVATFIVY